MEQTPHKHESGEADRAFQDKVLGALMLIDDTRAMAVTMHDIWGYPADRIASLLRVSEEDSRALVISARTEIKNIIFGDK